MGIGNYSATSNNMKLVHWPLLSGLLHLIQRVGDWARPQPAQVLPRCTKCNSPPINSQCNNHPCPLLCSFVPIKGLTYCLKRNAHKVTRFSLPGCPGTLIFDTNFRTRGHRGLLQTRLGWLKTAKYRRFLTNKYLPWKR